MQLEPAPLNAAPLDFLGYLKALCREDYWEAFPVRSDLDWRFRVMLATVSSHTQRETADVELAGRRFPLHSLKPQTRNAAQLRQLSALPDHAQIPEALKKEIHSRLSWAELPLHAGDVQSVVAAFLDSLNQLDQFRRDAERLMRTACEANLEFRQQRGETHEQARDAAMRTELEDMVQKAACDWPKPRNILDARLVSRPVSEVRERLNQVITEGVADFTNGLFALFAKLVDHELFGLVEWLPNNCCAYHFFKRVIIQENDGASSTVKEVRFDQPRDFDSTTGRRAIGQRTTRKARGEGRHTHRFARHQHDVMHAIRTSVENTRVVMPPHVERLCLAIPVWLKPFVEVIDGTIFRERIIERDMRVENWQDVQVKVEVIDEPIMGHEPGIIIGSYVLTGWGPREVEAELRRREAIAHESALAQQATVASVRYPIAGVGSGLLATLAVAAMFGAMSGTVSGWLVVITAFLSLAAAWQAAFDYATVRHERVAREWANLLTFSLGCQFATALWAIARLFQPLHWTIPVTLVALAVSAQIFLSLFPTSHRK